jgi:hypothetical protein
VLAPYTPQGMRDLAERDIGLDAGANSGQDVLRSCGRGLERCDGRRGGSRVATLSHGPGALDLPDLQPGVDGLRLRVLLLAALVDEGVETDDDALPRLDRALDLVGRVADRVRLVPVGQRGQRSTPRVDRVQLGQRRLDDRLGQRLDVAPTPDS